jgi:hypothetical protein
MTKAKKGTQFKLPFKSDWMIHHEYCGHLMPWRENMIVYDDEHSPECILEKNHDGEHLVVNKRGQFFCWNIEPDDIPESELDGSFSFGEIPSAEGTKLLLQSRIFAQKLLSTS